MATGVALPAAMVETLADAARDKSESPDTVVVVDTESSEAFGSEELVVSVAVDTMLPDAAASAV